MYLQLRNIWKRRTVIHAFQCLLVFWEDCTWDFIWLLDYWNLPQMFSSKSENNHCIQIETSKSHLKRFWLWTCSPLKWHCCQNKNRGVENENNWTIELFRSLTLPIPNEKIICWIETRGNETHGGRTNETLFWYVICENTVWCSLLPYPLLKSNSFWLYKLYWWQKLCLKRGWDVCGLLFDWLFSLWLKNHKDFSTVLHCAFLWTVASA